MPTDQPVQQQVQAPSQPQDLPNFDDMKDDSEGSLGEQAVAGLEGAARGVAGPVAPFVEKHLLLQKPSEMLARKEKYPITSAVGEGIGLAGSAISGVGEGALMEHASEAAAKALNLAKPVSYSAKIGSEAVNQAAQMAVMQSGDEIAQHIMNDPNTSSENALSNIGLASALGGVGGATMAGIVSPLWKATIGNRVQGGLEALTKHLGGTENDQGITDAITQSGLEIPEVIKPVLDNSLAKDMSSRLEQSDVSHFGKKYQKTLKDFNEHAGDEVVKTLGLEPNQIKNIELDKLETGRNLADSIHKDLKAEYEPIKQSYEKLTNDYKISPITDDIKRDTADQLAKLSLENGYHKASSDVQQKLIDKVIEDLPKQQDANDLKLYIQDLSNKHKFGTDTYQAGKQVRNILNQAQENTVENGIKFTGGSEADVAAKLAEYGQTKQQYKNFMNKIDNLNEHLHVGAYHGPESFLQNLKDLANTSGEKVLSRLSGKNANSLEQLVQFPEALGQLKRYHVDQLLSDATKRAGPDQDININHLLKKINELSPQLKQLVANEEQQGKLQAIDQVLNRLKDTTHNWSNTARTAEKLAHGMVSPISLVAGLMGHSGIGIATHVAGLGMTEGRDALRYGMLKFLASNKQIDSSGFKAMAEFLHNSIKGQSALVKGTGNVFKSGTQVLASNQLPTQQQRDRLDKTLDKLQENPERLQAMTNSSIGHYLPDHQTSLSQNVTQQTQYLQQLKPKPFRSSPLDREIPPSQAQQARYNRALDIAEKPTVVLQHIKDGTLQTTDLVDLKSMYPGVYNQMAQQLSNNMLSLNKEHLPYKTRIGLSLFLGQPVDSTMSPQAISAVQPQPKPTPQPMPKPKRNTSSMGKNIKTYETPEQARAADRAKRD